MNVLKVDKSVLQGLSHTHTHTYIFFFFKENIYIYFFFQEKYSKILKMFN